MSPKYGRDEAHESISALFDSVAKSEEARLAAHEEEARALWESLSDEDIEALLWKTTKEGKIAFLNSVRKDGGNTDCKHLLPIILKAKPYDTGVIPAPKRPSTGSSGGVRHDESEGDSSQSDYGDNNAAVALGAAAIIVASGGL